MSGLLVFVLPIFAIVATAVWAEWRLMPLVGHAGLADLLACLAGFCVATLWLFGLTLATGDRAVAQAGLALTHAARIAAALTLVAAPFACLMIALRPWPKGDG